MTDRLVDSTDFETVLAKLSELITMLDPASEEIAIEPEPDTSTGRSTVVLQRRLKEPKLPAGASRRRRWWRMRWWLVMLVVVAGTLAAIERWGAERVWTKVTAPFRSK